MSRSDRMFEIIQLLRGADCPLTSAELAQTLDVAQRTVYRDIAALQAMRVPIEGEAGIGYVMRAGFDLPPLMFTSEEVEAIVVGLALLKRTGDAGLLAASSSVSRKIAEVLPDEGEHDFEDWHLYVSAWGAEPPGQADLSVIRQAIREESKLRIAYRDAQERGSERTVKPLAILYYLEVVLLAAWCELRRDFRHFRLDRILSCETMGERFSGEGKALRTLLRDRHDLP
jgi:predicted DNA-binding transcriptional regulator YafY